MRKILGGLLCLFAISAGAELERSFELGRDQESSSFMAGLITDSCFGPCAEREEASFELGLSYTLTRIQFEDAGTGDKKIENEHLFSGQIEWLTITPWLLGASSRLFLAPDQGLQSRGAEISFGYEWMIDQDLDHTVSSQLIFGETKYEQRISLSTRRGTAEFNPELHQKSRGVELRYTWKKTQFGFSYMKYSYEEDVRRFLDFLNRPVGDFLLGASSGWVKGSQDQERNFFWSQQWSNQWSTVFRLGRATSLSDLESIQSLGAELQCQSEHYSWSLGFESWRAEGDAESSRFGYIGLSF